MQAAVEAYELGKLTIDPFFRSWPPRDDPDPFIVRPPGMDSFMVRPPGKQWLDQPHDDRDSRPLLPAWLSVLPYGSKFRSLTLEEFARLPGGSRAELHQWARTLVARYRQLLERQEAWIRLDEDMRHEGFVHLLPFDLLP
jgi:hypothetical protein